MTARPASKGLQLLSTVITVQRAQSGAAAIQPLLSARQITLRGTSAHPLEANWVKLLTHTAKVLPGHLAAVSIILN
jgi:hypothetical protein